jgi:hypothetical protein
VLNDRHLEMGKQCRTVWCMRCFQSREQLVRVTRRADGGDARFVGLQHCGSVWTCPVCSQRICEARGDELRAALPQWINDGPKDDAGRSMQTAYLLTWTFPHSAEDTLADLLTRQEKAMHRLNNDRRYKAVMQRYGTEGRARSLETTWGQKNGWHPHYHDLVFAQRGMEIDARSKRDLKRAWLRACIYAGLLRGVATYRAPLSICRDGRRRTVKRIRLQIVTETGTSRLKAFRDFWQHALDVRGGELAADYVAKFGRDQRWGLAAEMTRFHSKVGLRRVSFSEDLHFTPFQLLAFAAGGDQAARALFREFAACFAGKRALTWTPGLKGKFNIEERADEEIVHAPDVSYSDVGYLSAEQVSVVHSRNALPELVVYVSTCCADPATSQLDLDEYVTNLRSRPRTHQGAIYTRSLATPGGIAQYLVGESTDQHHLPRQEAA